MDSLNNTDPSDNWINCFKFKFAANLTPLVRNPFGPKINVSYHFKQKITKQSNY